MLVGRITPIKNQEMFIETGHLLLEGGIPTRLTIVGEPSSESDRVYLDKVWEKINLYKMSGSVVFTGSIPNYKMPDFYSKIGVTLNLTSSGGMDKVVLESFASGVPAFVSNDAFCDFLGDNASTFLFKEGDSRNLVSKIISFFKLNGLDRKKILVHLQNKVREEFDVHVLVNKIRINLEEL